MTALETFPARSRLACCGTCEAWLVTKHPMTRIAGAYCPRLDIFLVDSLETTGCAMWRQEPRETFAVELYQELAKEGAS